MAVIDGGEAFKRFDVVSDHSDHHCSNSKASLSNAVQKKIMKEWRILEQNLPDSIYVRVYENRIDLLRAVIVGAAGTPYHDGLFFFDIAFPPNYPTRPPTVCYRSYGLRLNPNLYKSGAVCLSLLNTWAGKKNERWIPGESTVLQVLVSIQGLVLNERPYFNEPGRGGLSGPFWEKKSRQYDGVAFIHSCSTMVYVLRKVPDHFGPFVRAHFMDRSAAILAACSEYANGRVRVGCYRHAGSGSRNRKSAGKIEVSESFKAEMRKVYPALIQEFGKIWAPLGNVGEMPEPAEKKSGLIKSVIRKVKKVLGLEKKEKEEGGKVGSAPA